jgi:predicted RNA-binding Zn ribbon-like protein
MPSREVDGLLLPQKVAHHPALELCNTRAWWGSAAPKEYLLSWRHAEVLAADLGLADPGTEKAGPLLRLLTLRADLYAVVTEVAAAASLRRLDAAIRAGRRDLELRDFSAGRPVWEPRSVGADRFLHAFARAAGELLSVPRRIGACPRCGWTFLDPSGRRKWCAMRWCGNRDKVQQHTRRTRAAARGAGE